MRKDAEMYQQEKDEKDEEDEAIEDERRDECGERAALWCRAVRHPRGSSTRNSNQAVKVGGNRVEGTSGEKIEGSMMHYLFCVWHRCFALLISAFKIGAIGWSNLI